MAAAAAAERRLPARRPGRRQTGGGDDDGCGGVGRGAAASGPPACLPGRGAAASGPPACRPGRGAAASGPPACRPGRCQKDSGDDGGGGGEDDGGHRPLPPARRPGRRPTKQVAATAAAASTFPRVPADPSTAPLYQEVLTGPRAGTIRSSGDETLHYNSRHPKIAKALVRTFKLLLKGFDVKSIVAAADCLPRRSKHPLILSLEPIQIRLCQVSVAFDCPLQPPRPGPIGIIHAGVENLHALGIEEQKC